MRIRNSNWVIFGPRLSFCDYSHRIFYADRLRGRRLSNRRSPQLLIILGEQPIRQWQVNYCGGQVMEIHQVRYFLALCAEQNFTRAARRCGVTQPSLTRAIKKMETELGGSLFDRDRTNTRLTDLGIYVRHEIERIDRSSTEVKRKAAQFLAAPSAKSRQRTTGIVMRAHHLIVVVVVLIVGFRAKFFLFPPKRAEADIRRVPV